MCFPRQGYLKRTIIVVIVLVVPRWSSSMSTARYLSAFCSLPETKNNILHKFQYDDVTYNICITNVVNALHQWRHGGRRADVMKLAPYSEMSDTVQVSSIRHIRTPLAKLGGIMLVPLRISKWPPSVANKGGLM
jgi:hypothetical protein